MAQLELNLKGKRAYERLRRRFQPRIGEDPRPPEFFRARAERLRKWFAEQPWSPTHPAHSLYGKTKSKNKN